MTNQREAVAAPRLQKALVLAGLGPGKIPWSWYSRIACVDARFMNYPLNSLMAGNVYQ